MAAPPPPPSTPLPPYNGAPIALPPSLLAWCTCLPSRLLSFGQWGTSWLVGSLGAGPCQRGRGTASKPGSLRPAPRNRAQAPLPSTPPRPAHRFCVAHTSHAAVGRARTWSSRHRGARTTSSSKPAKVARSSLLTRAAQNRGRTALTLAWWWAVFVFRCVGVAGCNEAIAALRATQPLPSLRLEPAMSIACKGAPALPQSHAHAHTRHTHYTRILTYGGWWNGRSCGERERAGRGSGHQHGGQDARVRRPDPRRHRHRGAPPACPPRTRTSKRRSAHLV
jgi:hypothetical protein